MVTNNKLRMTLIAAVAVLALVMVPSAMAQSSSVAGYGGQAKEVAGVASGGDPSDPGDPSGTVRSSGTLPFTGLDLGLLAGGGLLLLGIGITMARVVPRGQNAA